MNCNRCGIEISASTLHARKYKGNESDLCSDCMHLDRPFAQNMRNQCRAWSGEVDEDFNPIRNGILYRPGVRLCGRRDCVKSSHIDATEVVKEEPKKSRRKSTGRPVGRPPKSNEPIFPVVKKPVVHTVIGTNKPPMERPMNFEELLTAEQFDISYRTKKPLDFEQLMDVLRRERLKS